MGASSKGLVVNETQADARTRLLQASIEYFAGKGYHSTTTREIAIAANMSSAALYVHYKSKADVLFLICMTGLDELVCIMDEAADRSSGPLDEFRRVAYSFAIWHAEHSAMARVANYQIHALRPDHWTVVRGVRHSIEARVRGIIEAGMGDGVFHVRDSHMTTLSVISMGIDIARWYQADGSWTVDDVADHYRRMCLCMVGVV